MPTYQYACQQCGHQFEKRQRFNDQPLSVCPNCAGTVQRVISPVGIIFKGPGFYITDNKSKNGKKNGLGISPKSDGAEGAENGSSKTETKTTETQAAKPEKESAKAEKSA